MPTLSEELAELAELHTNGHLSDDEYNNAKAVTIAKYRSNADFPQVIKEYSAPKRYDQPREPVPDTAFGRYMEHQRVEARIFLYIVIPIGLVIVCCTILTVFGNN